MILSEYDLLIKRLHIGSNEGFLNILKKLYDDGVDSDLYPKLIEMTKRKASIPTDIKDETEFVDNISKVYFMEAPLWCYNACYRVYGDVDFTGDTIKDFCDITDRIYEDYLNNPQHVLDKLSTIEDNEMQTVSDMVLAKNIEIHKQSILNCDTEQPEETITLIQMPMIEDVL